MMRVAFVAGLGAPTTATNLTINIPAATMPNNAFICAVHCNDFGTPEQMTAPTGTATTTGWSSLNFWSVNTNDIHCRVWAALKTTGGGVGHTVTVTNAGSYASSLHVIVLTRLDASVTTTAGWLAAPAYAAGSVGVVTKSGWSFVGGTVPAPPGGKDGVCIHGFALRSTTSVVAPTATSKFQIASNHKGTYMQGGLAYKGLYMSKTTTDGISVSPGTVAAVVGLTVIGDDWVDPNQFYTDLPY